jgi:hypothetical protein
MNISLMLFIIGIIFIIIGYTHQVSPSCDKGLNIELIDRKRLESLNINQDSHLGSLIE